MKDINYNNCMKRKCQECKHYDYCFGYRGSNNETKKSKKKTI